MLGIQRQVFYGYLVERAVGREEDLAALLHVGLQMSPDEVAEVACVLQEVGVVGCRRLPFWDEVHQVALLAEVYHLGVATLLLQDKGAVAYGIVGEGDTQKLDGYIVVA